MAYENFKPTFWSKYIQTELDKKLVLADFTNRQFEGEVEHGKSVKILGVSRPTIFRYTGGDLPSPEEVNDTSVFLDINVVDAFNFMVGDIDRVQSVPGLMEKLTEGAIYGLKQAMDSSVAAQAVNAGMLSASTQIKDAAGAKSAVDTGLLWLRENDVDIDEEVAIELSPFVYQLMKDKYIELDTSNSEMLKKGILGWYDNARVRVSNNLFNDGTDVHCMIRTKNAIALANQVQKIKPFEPEKGFGDALKGFNLYGTKVVRPKELYVIKAHK